MPVVLSLLPQDQSVVLQEQELLLLRHPCPALLGQLLALFRQEASLMALQ